MFASVKEFSKKKKKKKHSLGNQRLWRQTDTAAAWCVAVCVIYCKQLYRQWHGFSEMVDLIKSKQNKVNSFFSYGSNIPENSMYIKTVQKYFVFIHKEKLSFGVCVLSRFSHVWLFVTLWTIARQAPLSMGFSRQEYWSWSPFPSPGNLPNPWIKPVSPGSPAWAGEIFITDSTVQPLKSLYSFADFWKIVRIIHMGPFDCVDQNKLWEILKGMEISDHLTCLLRNLHEG